MQRERGANEVFLCKIQSPVESFYAVAQLKPSQNRKARACPRSAPLALASITLVLPYYLRATVDCR
jgi:hypothetical protein